MSLEEMLATLEEISDELGDVAANPLISADDREARIQIARDSLARLLTESRNVA